MPNTNHHMILPYTLHFAERPKHIKSVVGRLPRWCRFKMSIASEAVSYRFSKVDIISQQLRPLHFFVNMLEIHSINQFQMEFEVKEDQLFLLFMLEGSIEFHTAGGKYITKAKTNHFYLSYNGPGIFKANMASGYHVVFVVAIKVSWAKKVFKELSNLDGMLSQVLNSQTPYIIMPQYRIDKQLHQWLSEAYSTTETSTIVLDSLFRMYITVALERYNRLLNAGGEMLAYQVKQYLDKHYTDQDITYNKLAKMFCATERTLRNQFKAKFHTTIHDYYTRLRMDKAIDLMETQNKAVKEIYFQVGYNDERSFRYAYNKFSDKGSLH